VFGGGELMGIPDEIRRLTEELLKDTEARQAAVMDIRISTAEDLVGNRVGLAATAEERRQETAVYLDDMQQAVVQHLQESRTVRCDDEAARRKEAARDAEGLRAELKAQAEWLREDLVAQRRALFGHVVELRIQNRQEHETMSDAQRAALSESRAKLAADTQTLLNTAGAARAAMSATQQSELLEFMTHLKICVGQQLQDAVEMIGQMDMAHHAMASEQRAQLEASRSRLAAETGAFLEHAAQAQAEAAVQRAQDAAACIELLQVSVEDMRQSVASFLAETSEERLALAADQRAALADARMKVVDARSQLSAAVKDMRAALQQDNAERRAIHAETQQAWQVFAEVMRARAMGNVVDFSDVVEADTVGLEVSEVMDAGERPQAQDPGVVEASEPETQEVDDLTRIRGVGQVTAKQLYAVGIMTFRELAASTPDAVRELIDASPLAKVEDWITEAGTLVPETE
jgi:gas vesicle GvpC-like protein